MSSSPYVNLLKPNIHHYTYWHQKEKFLFYEDTYEDTTIFAVEDGTFYYEVGDQKGVAALGNLVFCPPHVPFRRVVITPLSFHFIRSGWSASSDMIASDHVTTALPSGKISMSDIHALKTNYQRMKRASDLLHGSNAFILNHALQDIWLLYIEQNTQLPQIESDTHLQDRTTVDPIMAKARRLIQDQAFDPMKLKHLATKLGLTPSYLTKRFQSAYGVTPIAYLTSLRIDKAKLLLLETHLTLDQIADCIGYPNGYYLNRVFTKHVRITPDVFRRSHWV